MTTANIVEFLNARLTEDQAAAYVVPGAGQPCSDCHHAPMRLPKGAQALTCNWVCAACGATCEHHTVESHGVTARRLREVEAKRAILAVHQPNLSAYGERPCCSACWPEPKIGTHPVWPCSTVRALTAVYIDHPDYDRAWAPCTDDGGSDLL